ncbi:MAG: LptF/LptG family permease [Candidatus Omnitrophota bacterium]
MVKKIVSSYLFIILTFIGLHVIIDLFTNLNDFLEAKTALPQIISYYFYFLPMIFLRTSPFAIPISILFSLGELNKNNEIVTMRASGISLIGLSTPIIVFSLTVSFFSLLIQEKVLVFSQNKAETLKVEAMKDINKEGNKLKNVAFRDKNQLFFAHEFIPSQGKMRNVIILEKSEEEYIKEKIVCNTLTYGGGSWKAAGVFIYSLTRTGRMIGNPVALAEKEIKLELSPQTINLRKDSLFEYTSLAELRKEINLLKETATSSLFNKLIIEYHKNLTEPFSHFFLAIGIIPFALEIKKRKVGLSALAGGFIYGFLYYLIFSVSIALGTAGILIPSLSTWIAPLFFLSMGITGIIRIQ